MSDNADFEQVLSLKKRRLQELKKQQAIRGISTPPEISIEIEALEKEVSKLEAELWMIDIAPDTLTVSVKKWVPQTITFTNSQAEVYHHVAIRCQAEWPIRLNQSRFVLDDLVQGRSQNIRLEIRVDDEPDKVHELPLKLTIDNHPPQIQILRIFTEAKKILIPPGPPVEPSAIKRPGEKQPNTQRPDLQNIRTLLTEGFNDNELRRLCQVESNFRAVYEQLAEGMGKDRIIDKLIDHAERQELIEILLDWAKERNPAKYEKHQPYYIA